VDLAGGTLDIWPVYLFHPGAVTVNVAIDRRAWCRVETGGEGVQIESKDTLQKVSGRTVGEVIAAGRLTLAAHVLQALGVETGVRVVTQLRVPAGSGLGGASALAVAIAGAAALALERELGPDDIWPLTRDAEARALAVPTGVQDYHPAIRGGALCLHLEPAEIRVERLAVDPAKIEESLLLVDAGASRSSGIDNWGVFKGQIDGDARVREALVVIASVARQVREALVAGRFEDLVGLMAEEWEARKRLAPGWTTPEIDHIAAVVRAAGGAAKVCGAGGGGVVAVWAPPGARGQGRREAVVEAAKKAGLRLFPARVDLRGLDVEDAGGTAYNERFGEVVKG
jgi:D-glycero-alpha-D-manno-heptose-7-phosphate kinase